MSESAMILPLDGHREAQLVPFADNQDHLADLEHEVGLILAAAISERPDCPSDAATAPRQEVLRVRAEHRQREQLSRGSGVRLHLTELWESFKLNEIERDILLVLVMLGVAPRLSSLLQQVEPHRSSRRDGLHIGTLLKILCSDFQSQLAARRCFSIDGALVRNGLLEISQRDETESILDQRVALMERIVQFVIGDECLYPGDAACVRCERSQVSLDQVVLPEGVKERVVRHVANYREVCASAVSAELDRFFGYGTGLAMMFHGPTGSGKTMLAQGLANHFKAPLFTLTADMAQSYRRNNSDLLRTLFREANLHDGMVFFDEADDLFGSGTALSRALLIELEKSRCVVILATNKPDELDPALMRRMSLQIAFLSPDRIARRAIWRRLLPSQVKLDGVIDLDDYADRYCFSGGVIKNCVHMAVSQALVANPASPVLTMAMLDEAIAVQARKAGEGYGPVPRLKDLPLSREQQQELQRVKSAWQQLKENGTGIVVFLESSSLIAGETVAKALAKDVGLETNAYDFDDLILKTEKDYFDPMTTYKIPLMDFAFAMTEDGTRAMVIRDKSGALDYYLRLAEKLDTEAILFSNFLCHIRKHKGLILFLSDKRSRRKLPPEFVVSLRLLEPEDAMQMETWRRHLRGGMQDEDLRGLVAQYPLHLDEIMTMARQANVLAIMDGCERTSIAHVNQVLSRHGRQRTDKALLFGSAV